MKLVYYPNKILQKPCQDLILTTDLERERIKPRINRMFRIMKDHDGVGLSACQIGWPVNLFCVNTPDLKETFINPKITHFSPETRPHVEGCLSWPGLWLEIIRPSTVWLSYEDITGEKHEKYFEGLEARIIQHECEHLEGKNYTNAR